MPEKTTITAIRSSDRCTRLRPPAGTRGGLIAGGLIIGLLLSGNGLAQSAPLPNPPGFEQPSGLSSNGFEFYTRAQAGVQFTDNIRLDPSQKSDAQKLLAIDAAARSTWKRHAFAATVAYLKQQAVDTRDQGAEALSGTLSGRIDFSKTLNLRLGLLRQENIIGKNDPMQFNGNLNGTARTDTVEAGLGWDNKKRFVNLLGRHQQITNRTDINVSVLSRLQAQDREEDNLTLQAGLHRSWGKVYLFGGPQSVNYTGSKVILPEDRDSSGGRLGVGVEFKQGDLQGVVRAILFGEYFDAPTIAKVQSGVGIVQLIKTINERWAISGVAERVFDETNIQGSGGLFTNLVALGTRYSPRSDIYIKVGPAYRYYQIAGTSYRAQNTSLDATGAWQATKRLEFLLNATLSNQTVNDAMLANLQYGENAITLSAVLTY